MRNWFIPLLLCMIVCVGCTPNMSPMERAAGKISDDVLKPAVEKASAELASRTAQLQGQGSLINPSYVCSGHAIFGTGLVWEFELGAKGVSANLAGATQADNQATPKPEAKVEKPTTPAP